MERAPAFYWVLNVLGHYVLAYSSGSLSRAKVDHVVLVLAISWGRVEVVIWLLTFK
ncbi:hypothetical protein MNZ66_004472 [Salmonella enterica]|nr:hypothetical protein [Salmonella enterica]